MTAYGGELKAPELLPLPFSLDPAGIIPAFHRKRIDRKDEKGDLLVHLSLSFFSLAKLLN